MKNHKIQSGTIFFVAVFIFSIAYLYLKQDILAAELSALTSEFEDIKNIPSTSQNEYKDSFYLTQLSNSTAIILTVIGLLSLSTVFYTILNAKEVQELIRLNTQKTLEEYDKKLDSINDVKFELYYQLAEFHYAAVQKLYIEYDLTHTIDNLQLTLLIYHTLKGGSFECIVCNEDSEIKAEEKIKIVNEISVKIEKILKLLEIEKTTKVEINNKDLTTLLTFSTEIIKCDSRLTMKLSNLLSYININPQNDDSAII